MSKAIRIIEQLSRVAVSLLVLPGALVLSQCPATPPPPPPRKQVAIPPPSSRVCCIFDFAKALDPTKLGGHQYGNGNDLDAATSRTAEPVGYVYTAAAGLVDIGHLRDNADTFLWVYAHLLNGERNFSVGSDTVFVATVPTAKDPLLALAGAIVYVNSWAHELATWGDSPYLPMQELGGQEDYSAFSPEDLSSNIVGIEAATEAVRNGGDASPKAFNDQMDLALAKMMGNLGAQPAAETTKLLAQVEFAPGDKDLLGKWWTRDSTSWVPNFGIRLIRRNFDGAAWKIAGAPEAATPAWQNTTRFSSLYGQFLYLMSDKMSADATQIPNTTKFALAASTLLNWTPLKVGSIPTAARLADAIGGGSCLLGAGNKLISSGQFGTVKVNVYLANPQFIIAGMQDATDAIRKAFVDANSCIKGQLCALPAGAQDAGSMDAP